MRGVSARCLFLQVRDTPLDGLSGHRIFPIGGKVASQWGPSKALSRPATEFRLVRLAACSGHRTVTELVAPGPIKTPITIRRYLVFAAIASSRDQMGAITKALARQIIL